MERRLCVRSTHTAAVSALAYQPVRRELVTGHEDGSIKFWEGDTGKHTETVQQHGGWIADLFYWPEGKVLFSCSVDGQVVLWSSSNQPYDSILVGEPVFSMMWVSRKSLLLFGAARGVGALRSSERLAANGLPLLSHRVSWLTGHSGIVRCLSSAGNKIYTAGYDRKLLIHEVVSLSGDKESPLKTLHVNSAAHDAGITCLRVAKDTDGSTWVVTGSFDKKVKLWTGDGKLVHNIHCSDTVTGLCYVPQTRVVWVAAGTPLPLLYEPKSGDNVTDYAPILDLTSDIKHSSRQSVVQLLKYIPETGEVIGSTKLKELVCWKYNATCATCCHRSPSPSHVETLTFTSKVPILVFSGSFCGEMVKWEQIQLNSFLYSQDTLSYKEPLLKAVESEEDVDSGSRSVKHSTTTATARDNCPSGRVGRGEESGGRTQSRSDGGNVDPRKMAVMKAEQRGFVCSLFVESLDLLVASALDGTILVWGYDEHTVRLLEEMQAESAQSVHNDASHRQNNASEKESSSVVSRVAGFTCLHVLRGHLGSVQALAAVENWKEDGDTYLISGGWDLTLSLWKLSTGRKVTCLEESLPNGYRPHPNLIITSVAFSPHRSEFAYGTSDGQVFVRQFALGCDDWQLVRTLDGHHSDITQVCWNAVTGQWVTGSLDCTLRLWAGQVEEGGEEEMCVLVGDPVSVVCVDQTTGNIVAAAQSTLKVYNRNLELLQVGRGHTDTIRTLIHIPDRKQYVSASWDGTIRFWRAHQ